MAVFCISIFTMSLIPYTSPALADYRPWKSDEAPHSWDCGHSRINDKGYSGAIVVVDEDMLPIDEAELVLLDEALEEYREEEPQCHQ